MTAAIFLAPMLALIGMFLAVPVYQAFVLSFSDWDGFAAPQGVGLENFRVMFSDTLFRTAIGNNARLLAALPIWVLTPYVIALGLFSKPPGWRLFRIALFLPAVLSPVVLGIYYTIFLSPEGPLNTALRAFGLGRLAISWLNSPNLTIYVVVAILIWSGLGIGVVLFLAAFSNMDMEQVEAARLDGASWLQIQMHVVFWQMLPSIQFWSVIVLVSSFTGVFPLVYALTNGGPGHSTYFTDFALYQAAFQNGRLGYASAIGVTLLLIVATLGIVQAVAVRGRRG